MTECVLGFFIVENGNLPSFLLIRKNALVYNGLGGKVEIGEQPIEAMVREFEEESGIVTEPIDWHPVLTFYDDFDNYPVHVFVCYVSNRPSGDFPRTIEEGVVNWHTLIPSEMNSPCDWILPMLLDLTPLNIEFHGV